MMDREEEEIDRVLRALDAEEAGAGLEARVLARLERNVAPVRPLRRLWWAGGLVFATACVLLCLMFLPGRARQPAQARRPAVQRSPLRDGSAPYRSPAAVAVARMMSAPGPIAARILVAENAPAPEPAPDRGLANVPSMLAPPEPPTKQERLLLSVATGPRPDDFTILNPAVQELLAQRREAEFTSFFPPPTPQEIYLAEHASN